ncbi:NfeD family protein [Conexibacter stalactiti]|uniref:NfeD family protein n=1 Tax=Conexibacter stalactiti TaxID=1940611 RepID=A0ABU4HT06_9ACTN|nr:NfeD family protein [Conexibacter stalactiti]MDW5595889.1 NfeD family protein [Conexibacter stalactiti]MEC5036531.1 NfeD family protein [Conexibacter stalactiti]
MDDWVIWVILAVVFGAGEIMTTSFFLAPFGIGAIAAAIVAGVGAGVGISAAVFILVSVLMLLFVRPIARAHLKTPAQIRTGTAALIGRRAMVLERISNDDAVGSVRIDGEVWTARAYDEDEVIEAGRPVTVVEIKGATALVSE